ncbi:2,3-bisphosphoglycerate-independent phosphoglycerate mutase-like [Panonychus citri]|uniref:2,3-bisphosphoglycerate-independent phosphoglycerate mutase-like n=1 Tax=Panonychus citri TaxID=50023 RepID=UPI00230819A9|nr:2,3-bisphosphoglycerate-independent phosphoglycerate mutase-like [Panonychus citri]
MSAGHKVCLIVIDGWGISDEVKGNAILAADTPVMDSLAKVEGQYVTLDASGTSVGLPEGLMGNSEVGHLNIGAGRVMYQDIVRINMDVKSKKIRENPSFVDACNRSKTISGGRLHLLGLISDGGVHGHIEHLFSLLEGAKANGVDKVFIHFFSDGRDTSPTSGVTYLKQVLDKISSLKYGSLSTLMGRYYAMDRDKRWERTKIAYDGLVQGIGDVVSADKIIDFVKSKYEEKITDEFIKPVIINKEGLIKDKDTLVFFNYRSDRMRQIAETFGLRRNFETDKVPQDIKLYTMTKYKDEFPFDVLYPPVVPKNVLSEVVAHAKVKQFHCAETEKYAHVTFFFNGGQEVAFDQEERCMVPSPKVATYDLQPTMSAAGVGEKMVEAIESGKYHFIMCNFAPPDMVGHTGKYEPAVIACTTTDKAIGAIKEACDKHGYILLITSDHGNAERMIDEKGGPVTSHTTNRVPFSMTGPYKFKKLSHNAALCDVAPTVLSLMNIPIPKDMTGQSLVEK